MFNDIQDVRQQPNRAEGVYKLNVHLHRVREPKRVHKVIKNHFYHSKVKVHNYHVPQERQYHGADSLVHRVVKYSGRFNGFVDVLSDEAEDGQ